MITKQKLTRYRNSFAGVFMGLLVVTWSMSTPFSEYRPQTSLFQSLLSLERRSINLVPKKKRDPGNEVGVPSASRSSGTVLRDTEEVLLVTTYSEKCPLVSDVGRVLKRTYKASNSNLRFSFVVINIIVIIILTKRTFYHSLSSLSQSGILRHWWLKCFIT